MKTKTKILFLFILMFIAIMIPVNVSAADTIDVKVVGTYDYTKAQEVLDLLNEYRTQNNLGTLTMDEDLLNAAMMRSGETCIYFEHTRPNGTSCYTASSKMIAENIAAGQSTASGAMQSWKESPGHNASMLNGSYKSIGIGCFEVGGSCYWVQCFSNQEATKETAITGTSDVKQTVTILNSLVQVYAYSVKNATNANYMKPGEDGYLRYGIINQGWDVRYAPGDASDYNFSSSNSNVIQMNSDGTFKAVGEGQATIKLALKADSSKSFSETITVQRDNINVDYLYTRNLQSSYSYTGSEIKPNFILYYTMSRQLTEGVDYTLTYQNNVEPGIATIVITGIGKYKGTAVKSFEIVSSVQSPNITNYLFDATYYADRYPDLKAAFGYNESALRNHWLNNGIREGRTASPVFNSVYYINKYSDLKAAFGTNYVAAYNHFISNGIKEGRQGSKYFDVTYYLANNTDVKTAFSADRASALVHFATYGINEGRRGSNDFNVKSYYNSQNAYTKRHLGTTYLKYYALADGGSPINNNPIDVTNYLFDATYYANKYSDLRATFGYNESALRNHWLTYGIREGRSASPVFDPVYYLNKYFDLRAAFGADYVLAYNHFILNGVHEGRQASSTFNVETYVKNYSDLQVEFGSNYSKALEHYMMHGRNEGRVSV